MLTFELLLKDKNLQLTAGFPISLFTDNNLYLNWLSDIDKTITQNSEDLIDFINQYNHFKELASIEQPELFDVYGGIAGI